MGASDVDEAARLRRDIDTLNESIRLNWLDLEQLPLPREERIAIRTNIELLIAELQQLILRLEGRDANRT